jgi:hypothetical protein
MVTPDRIRLTGLLTEKPRKRGFSYRECSELVVVSLRQGFGGLVGTARRGRAVLSPATSRSALPYVAMGGAEALSVAMTSAALVAVVSGDGWPWGRERGPEGRYSG